MLSVKMDISKYHIVYSDFVKGYWTVPLEVLKQAIAMDKNLLIVDRYSNLHNTIPVFMLTDYDELDDEDYMLIKMPRYEDEQVLELNQYDRQLMHKFHYSWLNELWDYLHTSAFYDIIHQVNRLRESEIIVPDKSSVFNCFSTDLNAIRLVWVAKHSYKDKHNNGYLYSTYAKEAPDYLWEIETALKRVFPDEDIWTLRKDLIPLTLQGVFLFPKCLAISFTESYEELWNPFFGKIVEVLNRKPKLYWANFDTDLYIPTHHPVITLKDNNLQEFFKEISNHVTVNYK